MLGRALPPSTTDHEPLPGAPADGADWPTEAARLRDELPWPDEVVDRLLAVYGTRCRELLALSRSTPELGRVLGTGRGALVAAEVVVAVEQEGAAHLTDILHRRTMIGLEPGWGREIHREVAELAAPLLGWSADDVRREVADHDTYIAERCSVGLPDHSERRGTRCFPRRSSAAARRAISPSSRPRGGVRQVVDGVADDPAGTDGLFVCPSFPLIPTLLASFGAAGGLVGAQDVSVHPSGPYTGEVSAEVLAQLGVRLVMAGHPERRRLFGETDDVVRRKVTAAATAGMAPILVVGEQEEGESAERAVAAQLDAWLADLPPEADVLVAYEPAWAIGRPQPAPPGHVATATLAVRGLLDGRVRDPRVVYGGSAQPGTFGGIRDAAGEPAAVPDGVFMARFGLDPKDFLTVVAEVRGRGMS